MPFNEYSVACCALIKMRAPPLCVVMIRATTLRMYTLIGDGSVALVRAFGVGDSSLCKDHSRRLFLRANTLLVLCNPVGD